MKLDYIYHSGFAIETHDTTIIIDYFKDSSETAYNEGIVHDRLLNKPGKLYVLSTHSHADHCNPEVLTGREKRPDIIYIFSKDILENHKVDSNDAIYLDNGEAYTDDSTQVDAYGSQDSRGSS